MLDNDNCSEELLMTAEEVRQLTKYGTSGEPPRDDAIVHPTDDRYKFFEWGRELASISTNHKYTAQERNMLAAYESLEYLPSHSTVYKNWIKRHPPRRDWHQWLMMGLIGFTVGCIGFVMHQLIDLISSFKWNRAKDYLNDTGFAVTWAWVTGVSVAIVTISSALIVFIRPQAASSGIPELMAFLNGTVVRHIFNVKTLIIKFFSCVCAVASGMPVGPEGPMIHMGSLVGAGLSQFKSDTMKFKLPCFERFRNFEDRRNFISAGAAAGVAAAFGAPVGGVLFSMEEVSSFWNMKLTWQIFFCAMISTFTADLFNSSFSGFVYQGYFGMFKAEEYILFKVQKGIPINILAFIPAVILGVIGGFMGALYTFLNLKIVKSRRRILAGISRKWLRSIVKIGEPMLIMVVVATMSVYLPALFSFSPYVCNDGPNIRSNCNASLSNVTSNLLHTDPDVQRYKCPTGIFMAYENYTFTNSSYNEMATLLFGTTDDAIHQLFSRNTHVELGFIPLLVALVFYFTMSCFAAGTSIASGILVPMLFIGGLYGRMVGLAVVSLFGIHTEENSYGSWMDPGAFALVGAASFFGGVSRLTMSLAVIMIEMTNDVQFLLPIMASIMIAKWVGDFFTHPYYLSLMELKCIPYLDADPIVKCNGRTVSLELHCARDVMACPPVVVRTHESVNRLSELLLNTNHGGFPVVRKASNGEEVFFGSINRLQLAVLLKHRYLFVSHRSNDSNVDGDDYCPSGHLDYPLLTLDKFENPESIEDMLLSYTQDQELKDAYINLVPYVNQSAVSIPGKFSLERTYIIFRTLGLRHMIVVDELNHVTGVITRKDLMGFNMAEKLSAKNQNHVPRRFDLGEISDDEMLLVETEND